MELFAKQRRQGMQDGSKEGQKRPADLGNWHTMSKGKSQVSGDNRGQPG